MICIYWCKVVLRTASSAEEFPSQKIWRMQREARIDWKKSKWIKHEGRHKKIAYEVFDLIFIMYSRKLYINPF